MRHSQLTSDPVVVPHQGEQTLAAAHVPHPDALVSAPAGQEGTRVGATEIITSANILKVEIHTDLFLLSPPAASLAASLMAWVATSGAQATHSTTWSWSRISTLTSLPGKRMNILPWGLVVLKSYLQLATPWLSGHCCNSPADFRPETLWPSEPTL